MQSLLNSFKRITLLIRRFKDPFGKFLRLNFYLILSLKSYCKFTFLTSFLISEPAFAIDGPVQAIRLTSYKPWTLRGIFDSILWAPKKRRTVEMRHIRKFGLERFAPSGKKMWSPLTNLRICDTCGNWHKVHALCEVCYNKVKEETKHFHEAMFGALKRDPIEHDLVAVYKDEPKEYKGKRIIEVDRPRPAWFSKNLLTRGGPLSNKWVETNAAIPDDQAKIKDS